MKLTEARRAALAAAANGGVEWFRGDAAKSRTLSWLYDQKLVAWDGSRHNRFVIATPAGRAALTTEGSDG